MGVVYKGFDPVIERAVALKTIRKHLIDASAEGAEMAARFRNEARAAGRLVHPGIVAIYEYGESADDHDGANQDEDRVAYIAMEYVEGITVAHYLARHVARGEMIPLTDLADIMAQLLAALHYAHEQGVWHRDVKPANLILATSGTLKIADFGIARLDNASFTQAHAVIGTPSYMAPEQIRGAPIDRRMDVYAAGVVLYQLLTNRLPFEGSASTIMYNVVNTPVPAPSTIPLADPAQARTQFDAIIARALAKEPQDRYQTAAEFGDALRVVAQMQSAIRVNTVSGFAADDNETVALGAQQSRKPPMSPVPPAPPMPSAALDAAWLDQVTLCLARQRGPIAKIMVRKATANAPTRAALIAALCAQIEDAGERQAMSNALQQL